MDELIKLLDENIQYLSHEMNHGVIEITVASTRASRNYPYCDHKTFAERFNFLESKAKKSIRLKDEIIEVALTQSSIWAS